MTETRQELEARLKAATDSMARRLNSMEDEVKLPGIAKLSKAIGGTRGRKIAAAAAAGLLVGLVFGGGKKKSSNGDSDAAEKGLIVFLMGYMMRAGVNAVVRELMNRALTRNGEEDRP